MAADWRPKRRRAEIYGAAPGQAYRVQLTLLDNVTGEVVPAVPVGLVGVADDIVILPEKSAP